MFRPPASQTVSEWADTHRVLVSESSAEPGPWRTDRAPYQREIMDAFTQKGIWQIVIMASAQVGKSEIELNMMGCAIDNDPGPMLYIQPTKDVAEDYSKRRIAPMIDACPTLRSKVSKAKGRDAANTITMKTFPGGSLAIIGANSPADLSSKPVRYIFMDETDRFPASAGAEGDPQELAERRTETFRHNRKIIKTSTPTIKGKSKIETDYMNGTQEEWHTQCPACQTYSYIRFADIQYDAEEYVSGNGDKDYHIRSVAWRCPVCKRDIDEHACKRLPDAGKEGIMYEAGISEPGPNYMHFPLDFRAGYDKEFFRGLISEKMVIHRRGGQGVIKWEKFYERNEPLDCRNYARAAYRYFNWRFDELERIVSGMEEPKKVITKGEETKRKNRHVVSRGIKV